MEKNAAGITEKFYSFLTQKFVLIISLLATAAFTLILTKIDAMASRDSGLGIVHLELAFTRETFWIITKAWGPDGVSLLLRTIWVDYLYPLSYALLFSSAIAHFISRTPGREPVVLTKTEVLTLYVPPAAALFDFAENTLLIYILNHGEFPADAILVFSSVSVIKWVLVGLSLVFLLHRYFSMRKTQSSGAERG